MELITALEVFTQATQTFTQTIPFAGYLLLALVGGMTLWSVSQ